MTNYTDRINLELLAALKGGGSLSGASGQKITSQLKNIISEIQTKKLAVLQLDIDTSPQAQAKMQAQLNTLIKSLSANVKLNVQVGEEDNSIESVLDKTKQNFLDKLNDDMMSLSVEKVKSAAASIYQAALQTISGSSAEGLSESQKAVELLQNFIVTAETGKVSIQGYAKSILTTSTATKTFSTVTQLAKAAVGSLVAAAASFVVSAIVTKIQEWANAEEAAAEAMKERIKTAKEDAEELNKTNATLEQYKEKIIELRTELDSGNLSQSEAYKKRKELLGIQEEMIKKYDLEAESVDLLNDSLKKSIALLEQQKKENATQWLNRNEKAYSEAKSYLNTVQKAEDNGTIFWDSYTDYHDGSWGAQTEWVTAVDELLTRESDLFQSNEYANERVIQKLSELFQSQGGAFTFKQDYMENWNVHSSLTGTREEIISKYETIIEELRRWDEEGTRLIRQVLSKKLNYWDSDTYKDSVALAKEGTKQTILSDATLSNYWASAAYAAQAYQEAIASNDEEASETALKSFQKAKASFEEAIKNGEISDVFVQKYFADFFEEFETMTKGHTFRINFSANRNGMKDSISGIINELDGLTKSEILDLEHSGTSAQKELFASLQAEAEKYKLSVEELVEQLVILEQIKPDSENKSFDISNYINDVNQIQQKIQNLQSIINAIENRSFSSSDLFSLIQQFPEYSEYLNDAIYGYANLKRALEDGISDAPQKLIDGLNDLVKTLDEPQKSDVNNFIAFLEKLPSAANNAAVGIEELSTSYSKFQSKMSGVASAYKTLLDGEALSFSQTIDLITNHKELLKYVDLRNGSLKITKDLLTEIFEIEKQNQITSLRNQKKSLENNRSNVFKERDQLRADRIAAQKEVKKYEEKLSSSDLSSEDRARYSHLLSDAIDTYNGAVQAYLNVIAPARKEWETLTQEINDTDALIALWEGITVSDFDSEITPGNEASSRWQALLSEKKHALAMEQITEEEYYHWLRKNYLSVLGTYEETADERKAIAEELYNWDKAAQSRLSDAAIETWNKQLAEKKYLRDLGKISEKEYYDWVRANYQSVLGAYEETLDERRSAETELYQWEQGQLESAKNALEELISYRLQMLQKEKEAEKQALSDRLNKYKEFYDKQKELLRDRHDEETYLEQQAEKRKKITDLELRIHQLSPDDSAKTQRKILELQEELSRANQELADFEKDYNLKQAEELYDKLYESAEASINGQIELIDQELENAKTMRDAALSDLMNGNDVLYQQMIEYNRKYGSAIDAEITEKWQNAYQALKDYRALLGEDYSGLHLSTAAGGNMAAEPSAPSNSPSKPTVHSASAAGSGSGSAPGAPSYSAYTLSDSDTLWSLARRYYGDGRQWTKISAANGNLDPYNLYAGMVIRIPSYAGGTAYAAGGLSRIDEQGAEIILSNPARGRYALLSSGDKVFNVSASDFLYRLANHPVDVLAGQMTALLERLRPLSPAPAGTAAAAPSITFGDFIVHAESDADFTRKLEKHRTEVADTVMRVFKRLQ